MITIITTGDIKQKELAFLQEMYLKRINKMPHIRLKILTLKSEYEKKVLDLAKKDGHQLFILTEQAKTYDTEQFKSLIQTTFSENESFTFVLGPPEGFSDELKKELKSISLSPMTLTHEWAQVLLVEQIYRACCLYHNRPYHKA